MIALNVVMKKSHFKYGHTCLRGNFFKGKSWFGSHCYSQYNIQVHLHWLGALLFKLFCSP